MGSAHSFWVAVIMLVVCGSHEGIARTQHDGHEQTDLPCTLRVIPHDTARLAATPSPGRGEAWLQVAQANACGCPAIICSELQRSPACQVSCARGRSAYCQCGSCTGISLSSANVCTCR
ncbi:MAG TPA: hypothetical protein VI542_35880 [Candidatus Tectomicrobia bacterium]